jgi:dTDP-4-dehydrorhamnose reductase
MTKILITGASGMIGSTMLRALAGRRDLTVVGSVRSEMVRARFPGFLAERMVAGFDLADGDSLTRLLLQQRPDVVVNCAGLTKHLPAGNDPISAIAMNALLPHRLSALCALAGARLIHISTDCVFSGRKGNYAESDPPDANDVYGRTKHLGEVGGKDLTIRTSTIGHEFFSRHGLLEWFLAQSSCKGYRRAIFSGLTTLELARVVGEEVIPHPELTGLYHVGATPIDKDSLLRLVASVYGKTVLIDVDEEMVVDRSLDIHHFTSATGYVAPDWQTMVEQMYREWSDFAV